MKIRIYQYFAWAYLGFCMACNSGIPEYEGESEQVREVTFRVSQMGGRLARAMATNFEVGDSIGIYAVKRDIPSELGILTISGNQAHNAKWIKTTEGWSPASLKDKIVFPQDGGKLDFYAYYPYSSDAVDPEEISMGVKTDQRADEGWKSSDWMTAVNTEGINEGEVDLIFKHIMASVEVNVIGGKMIMPNEGLQVQVVGVCLKNSFHLGTGRFTVETGTGTIDMQRLEGEEGFRYGALLPAQILEAGMPVMRCLLDGKIYIYRGEEVVLESGNRTRFEFTLKSGDE